MLIDGVSFGGEHFHPTITQLSAGDIFMVVGHEHSSIVKLEGFESVRRRLRHCGGHTGRGRSARGDCRRARCAQLRDTLVVGRSDKDLTIDGNLEDWPTGTVWADIGGRAKAALMLGKKRLFAAFRTDDPGALANRGGDFRYLFKAGGARPDDRDRPPRRSRPARRGRRRSPRARHTGCGQNPGRPVPGSRRNGPTRAQ